MLIHLAFAKKKGIILLTTLILLNAPIAEALFIKQVNINNTLSTANSSYFQYNFYSTSTLRPNDSANTVSVGYNQSITINFGVIYKVANSLLLNNVNNVISIQSKTDPDNLKLRIIDGTSPLGLVGLSDILLLPTNTYSFNYGTTKAINMTIQLGILFTAFGQFTGSLEVKSLTTGNVIKIIPISMFVTLL